MALSSPIIISHCHLLMARFGTLSCSTFIAHSRGKDKLGVLCFIFFAFCLFLEEGKVYFNQMYLIGLNGTAILIFTDVKNSFLFLYVFVIGGFSLTLQFLNKHSEAYINHKSLADGSVLLLVSSYI